MPYLPLASGIEPPSGSSRAWTDPISIKRANLAEHSRLHPAPQLVVLGSARMTCVTEPRSTERSWAECRPSGGGGWEEWRLRGRAR